MVLIPPATSASVTRRTTSVESARMIGTIPPVFSRSRTCALGWRAMVLLQARQAVSGPRSGRTEPRRPGVPPNHRGVPLNGFDWTFSGSAEVVTGILVLLTLVAAAFA